MPTRGHVDRRPEAGPAAPGGEYLRARAARGGGAGPVPAPRGAPPPRTPGRSRPGTGESSRAPGRGWTGPPRATGSGPPIASPRRAPSPDLGISGLERARPCGERAREGTRGSQARPGHRAGDPAALRWDLGLGELGRARKARGGRGGARQLLDSPRTPVFPAGRTGTCPNLGGKRNLKLESHPPLIPRGTPEGARVLLSPSTLRGNFFRAFPLPAGFRGGSPMPHPVPGFLGGKNSSVGDPACSRVHQRHPGMGGDN